MGRNKMNLKIVYGDYHVYENRDKNRMEVWLGSQHWLFDLPFYFPLIHIETAIAIYTESHLIAFMKGVKKGRTLCKEEAYRRQTPIYKEILFFE